MKETLTGIGPYHVRKARFTPTQRFFYDHAGYSYDPKTESKHEGRRKGALVLAEAETWAEDMGLTYHWDWDQCADLGDHDVWCSVDCGKSHEVLEVLAKYRDGSVAGSLGGIIDADANYRRVIEAELASEAKHEVEQSVFEAI